MSTTGRGSTCCLCMSLQLHSGQSAQVPLFLTSSHCPQPLPPIPGNPPAGQAHACALVCMAWELQWNSPHISAFRCCLSKCQKRGMSTYSSSVLGLSHPGSHVQVFLTPPPLVMASLGPVHLCTRSELDCVHWGWPRNLAVTGAELSALWGKGLCMWSSQVESILPTVL